MKRGKKKSTVKVQSENEAYKGMMTDTGISKTKPSARSYEKSKIPVKNESKEGHDKQLKGRREKVIHIEEIITQERKEEIIEESHYTFKTSRIQGNVKKGKKDKEIFPINIKMQASENEKYFEPDNTDENHTLSHGGERLQNENVKKEKTNNGKRLRKSTFTVGEFNNRVQENGKVEHRRRELDNSNVLCNTEKNETVKVSTKDTSVDALSKEIIEKSKKEKNEGKTQVSEKHIPFEKTITMQFIDNEICKDPSKIENKTYLECFYQDQDLENKTLGKADKIQQMVRFRKL